MMRSVSLALMLAAGATAPGQEIGAQRVGVQPDGRVVVPTNQILQPAGAQVTFPGRPVDLLAIDGGRTLVVKNLHDLVFIDSATGRVRQTLRTPGSGRQQVGFSVVGLAVAGDRVYASDAQRSVRVARRQADGAYDWDSAIDLPTPAVGGNPHPAGLAVLADGTLAVAATRGNCVHFVDPAARKVVQTVPVGVAPYGVLRVGGDRLYVSNWGGAPAGPNDRTAPSSGTPARVDDRGIANSGTVSVLRKMADAWAVVKAIEVGLHPSGLAASPDGRFVYVANASSDTVSVIDTRTDAVAETVACRPEARLPFGSGSNAVELSPDGGTLYVANGTNNCVAVVRLGKSARDDGQGPERTDLAGLIPAGWYPGAVAVSADGKRLFVANVKGHGSLSQPRDKDKGHNSRDFLGSVSLIDLPDAAELGKWTGRVNANNRLAYSLAGLEKPRPGVRPVPVPERHGEPSVIEHVVYVVKENRTYDQVLGDMKEGNGDPKLCIFGEEVTPNEHKLAREFALLDNFYCSGVLSADGHQWTNEAYVTDYLEKQFGGFTRSYPYEGSDPLAYAPSGFIWDNALAHGKTFRNFGEFVRTAYAPRKPTWTEMYADVTSKAGRFTPTATPNVANLKPYSHPRYPGFELVVPDQYRANLFLDELAACERRGSFPSLVYVFLPCDHTSGTRPNAPTPRAMVADNDLALGRIVEGIGRSKFWPKTCILVVEDDPQNGFDHVDGHRTVAFAVSPYTRRKAVDSTCYNQTGMVKTIELMLGLPPMNQLDLSATPMRGCFHPTPDLTSFTHVANRVPLDEMNKPLTQLGGRGLFWAKKSLELDLDDCDAADEDTLNRILWYAAKGDAAYPKDGR
ncbi:MAG TPA: bifunctional YncE family protein/alkaline phosphatase family protein [Gemmataceae bacterium]